MQSTATTPTFNTEQKLILSSDFADDVSIVSSLNLLDDPAEWSIFSRQFTASKSVQSNTQTYWESQLVIQGMHCAACALTIEDALKAVPGIIEVNVNAASQRASVVWDAQQVVPSRWFSAVQAAGYQMVPANDAFARERRQNEQRRMLWRWLVAGFCMMQVMMYAWPAYVALPGDMAPDMVKLLRWASWVISLPVVFFACGPFFKNAWRDIRNFKISMDLPVALGMAITFVVSSAGTFDVDGLFGAEVYFDSLTMFVFFLLTGRWLELRLRDRTAGALEDLMNRLPDSIERQITKGKKQGQFERVAVRRLAQGDLIKVLPGEVFPADGVIECGSTYADEAILTGESTPVVREQGDTVIAGSYNVQAVVQVRVERTGAATRFSQIVTLMESAATQKPRLAQLADRVAKPFLLGVLLASALAILWWWPDSPSHALMVGVAVLIVTCPCALSLATPAAMLTAAGALARHGILVRELQAFESLVKVDTVVFDKTGTLTSDNMTVTAIQLRPDITQAEVVEAVLALAIHSMHPVSRALMQAYSVAPESGSVHVATKDGVPGSGSHFSPSNITKIKDFKEIVGGGLTGVVGVQPALDGLVHSTEPESSRPLKGSLRLGSALFCGLDSAEGEQRQVHLSDDSGWVASFTLAENIRADARVAIESLQKAGVKVSLLSGDRAKAVQRVAAALGIEQAQGDCSPQDKLEKLRQMQNEGCCVAMVGDGLNDGPVLAGAHVSFAFGKAVPLAQAQADFVVLGDRLMRVVQTLLLARHTLSIVKQNLVWAATYNAICVPLAVVGWLPAWLAGLGMALSSLLVVLNAMRLAVLPQAMSELKGV